MDALVVSACFGPLALSRCSRGRADRECSRWQRSSDRSSTCVSSLVRHVAAFFLPSFNPNALGVASRVFPGASHASRVARLVSRDPQDRPWWIAAACSSRVFAPRLPAGTAGATNEPSVVASPRRCMSPLLRSIRRTSAARSTPVFEAGFPMPRSPGRRSRRPGTIVRSFSGPTGSRNSRSRLGSVIRAAYSLTSVRRVPPSRFANAMIWRLLGSSRRSSAVDGFSPHTKTCRAGLNASASSTRSSV